MRKVITIDKLLEYLSVNEQNEEATESDIFGKYLFADPKNKVRKDVPHEMDTETEEEFLFALISHYEENDDAMLSSIAPRVFELINAGKYTNILKPNQNERVYRIINLEHEPKSLSPFIGDLNPKEVYEEVMHKGFVRLYNRGVLNPNKLSKIQSWTTSDMVLFDFASDDINIIIGASPKDNANTFFMNPHNIRKTFSDPYGLLMGDEREVISYGPVKYYSVYIARDSRAVKSFNGM